MMNKVKVCFLGFVLTICLLTKGEASFSFSGEYLYFKPVLNSYYALPHNIDNPIQGPRLAADYDFSSGYRVAGAYRFFCERASFLFRWSSLHSSNEHSTSGINVEPVNVPDVAPPLLNVIAIDNIDFDYNSFDALLGWRLYEPIPTSFYVGLHYIKTSNRQNDVYSGISGATPAPAIHTVLWSTEVRGIGPELALSAQYCLPRLGCLPRLELLGSMQIGALVVNNGIDNQNSSDYFIVTGFRTFSSFSDEEIQKIVPFWDLRLGIGSSTCLGLFTVNLSLGYEILSYYNLFKRPLFLRIGGPTFDSYEDIYLHGLFLRLGIGF